MNLPDRTLSIHSTPVKLGEVLPVLNGKPLADFQIAIKPNAYHYQSPELMGGTFGIEILPQPDTGYILQYWLEGLPADFPLDSFGLRFAPLENLRAFLRNGYFSWDGSFYVEVDNLAETSEAERMGYAMTQLLPRYGSGSLVVGFDRHDRFQQTFTLANDGSSLIALTLWDRKTITGRCESEKLLIFAHTGVEDGLREWAKQVAQASPLPPRQTEPITGWCSWYNLYGATTEENILDHLHTTAEVARREKLPMRVFQIDDGFTPEMGDWLEVKPLFPRGMKPLLNDIRAAGFVPGLWIAPFMVGNRSHLYRDHPDWVVQDRHTGEPLIQMHFYGEFRWHKRSEEYYILDTTHPAAFEYIRQVFRIWREEWGCEYFKTDFMHFGCAHGADRAVWHRAGLTRMEIWRQVAEMIRDEIGDALWLGCGCPLWASVGLVDGIRIGKDVGVIWEGNQSAQSLLRGPAMRNFAHRILWQADPDCILLRERFHHLSEIELCSLALYAGMFGGVLMTSDALHELSEERLNLWKLILDRRGTICSFPLLGQRDAVLVQVNASPVSPQVFAVFIFNTADQLSQRSYPLSLLGLPSQMHLLGSNTDEPPIHELTVTLNPHEGKLFFLSKEALPASNLPS
jgi:hypothetical protein